MALGGFVNTLGNNSSHESNSQGTVKKSGAQTLLGQIKDPTQRSPISAKQPFNPAGVPPADIGFNMIKDMIDFESASKQHINKK